MSRRADALQQQQQPARGMRATRATAAAPPPAFAGLGIQSSSSASRAPPSITSRSARAESVLSTATAATRSRLGDTSARKRRRVFSGERQSVAPSVPSASVSPRAPFQPLRGPSEPFNQQQQQQQRRSPQRLRPSLQHGPNGALNVQALADRCSILAIQSKSVLDFYGKFQVDSWTDQTISRMNAVWQPFESYKVRQLLAERDYAHHFIDIHEVVRELNVDEDNLPHSFEETMQLVNFATFIHYIFQLPTSIKALGELEDGRVTEDIAIQAPIRALIELNDARRVFLKWIVPPDWRITDEILFLFLDLSTFIHAQRVRLYVDSFEANHMARDELDARVESSIVELMSDDVLNNSLSLTAEERGLSPEDVDRIRTRYSSFANLRTQDLLRCNYNWLDILRQWPANVLTDEFLQLAEKAIKDPSVPLTSRSLQTARAAAVPDMFDRDQTPSSSRFGGPGNGTVIIRDAPGESTPQPRDQLGRVRRPQPRRDSAIEDFPPEVQVNSNDASPETDAEDVSSDGGEELDADAVRRRTIFSILGDPEGREGTNATATATSAATEKHGARSSRSGKRTTFSGVDLAGDEDEQVRTVFPTSRHGRPATPAGLPDGEDADDDDDIPLHEKDEDGDDPHERSQILATRTAAKGRVSIGAEAAKGQTTGRAMSSHVQDVSKTALKAPASPLGARSTNRIGIGKDNKLTKAAPPRKGILSDKSKGERITFDEDGDDDVFMENERAASKQSKKQASTPPPSSNSRRTTRRGAAAVGDAASATDDEPAPVRQTRASRKGKERAVDEDPAGREPERLRSPSLGAPQLETVQEEGTQAETYNIGDGMGADFGGDEDIGIDDFVRDLNKGEEDNLAGGAMDVDPASPGHQANGKTRDDADGGHRHDDDSEDSVESEIGGHHASRKPPETRAGTRSFPPARPSQLQSQLAAKEKGKSKVTDGASQEEVDAAGSKRNSRSEILASVGRKSVVENEEDEDEDKEDAADEDKDKQSEDDRRKDRGSKAKAKRRKKAKEVSDEESAEEEEESPAKRRAAKKRAERKRRAAELDDDSDEEDEEEASAKRRAAKKRANGKRRATESDEDSEGEEEEAEAEEEEKEGSSAKRRASHKRAKRKRQATESDDSQEYSPSPQPEAKKQRPRYDADGKRLKPYLYGIEARRFWSPDETHCLLKEVWRLAFQKKTNRQYQIWDKILQLHGRRGTKTRILARRNNVQVKDKARSELQRMRREMEKLPYWYPVLFPTLFDGLPKAMRKKIKVERMPKDFNKASSSEAESEEEDEVESHEEEDEDDEATPPPAKQKRKTASSSSSTAAATTKSRSKPSSKPRLSAQQKEEEAEYEEDDDANEIDEEEEDEIKDADDLAGGKDSAGPSTSTRKTRSSGLANGGASASSGADDDGAPRRSPRKNTQAGAAAAEPAPEKPAVRRARPVRSVQARNAD
ncbi:hypothetical protein OC835_001109 [Tilletia horrida]|nr:hypothetical protein OC835_001109 [Tilletia horrida]